MNQLGIQKFIAKAQIDIEIWIIDIFNDVHNGTIVSFNEKYVVINDEYGKSYHSYSDFIGYSLAQ